ncbi:hypothetical protein V6N13_140387 [Hibiscus sabdariffa]|uniref:Uncharacterized protein n=1 Tax=Hibiscus sabdariffa TaxID=183260 RepID=A0ABR2QA54_9ROSI
MYYRVFFINKALPHPYVIYPVRLTAAKPSSFSPKTEPSSSPNLPFTSLFCFPRFLSSPFIVFVTAGDSSFSLELMASRRNGHL